MRNYELSFSLQTWAPDIMDINGQLTKNVDLFIASVVSFVAS